jgi:rhamnose utilization protein RhaD (predicted bifunctional aldolase and dehydrogenase)/NAD(P)-dependent dehydrogenase (short-subunit alcohol dehydrogenase family)
MKSLWQEQEASQCNTELELRAYTSRLLGRNDDLVLHGGGNTSLKGQAENIFGESEDILYIKGSGHDLKTIGTDGFAPTRLDRVRRLATLDSLSDTDMVRELKCAQTDPKAPTPSVEAILHALIPHRYVDHTHTDAVVAISNTPAGEQLINDVFGAEVLVLPYVMPGFILAKQVYEATKGIDWDKYKGIVLLHHGLFTFHDDARQSYENMIDLVTQAERYLEGHTKELAGKDAAGIDAVEFARFRRSVADQAGRAVNGRFRPLPFATVANAGDCGRRGPITPDHVLHTKRVPMLMTGNVADDVAGFASEYQRYFDSHTNGELTCLDLAPRWGIYPEHGVATFGINAKRLGICSDIIDHTVKAIQWGEQLGGWQALPEQDIFELEYWELEQAKLKNMPAGGALDGKVALVTGAASGIGRACAEQLMAQGACVIGIDILESITDVSTAAAYLGLVADLTATEQVRKALATGVWHFGGIDILVSNAGSFPASNVLENTSDADWHSALGVNLDSHFKVLREASPYLRAGIDPAVVVVASKNVLAPGPGAGPYSVAKAALTQLARVAALELAEHQVRVNVLHPDAIFDTGIWTDEVLAERAKNYGISVAEYKKRNLLGKELSSADVARAVVALADNTFAGSTGLQLTIDGGNERTI